MWTECDNQPTDGTDETRINQKINTNRDDTEEKIEVREPFMTLKSIETQEVTQKGALPWRTDQLNFSVDIYIYTYKKAVVMFVIPRVCLKSKTVVQLCFAERCSHIFFTLILYIIYLSL